MHSARFSVDYVPRVNLSAYLIRPGEQETVYDETIYYGADSSGNASWSVPANPAHRWSSFGELVAKPQEVARSYDEALEPWRRGLRRTSGSNSGRRPRGSPLRPDTRDTANRPTRLPAEQDPVHTPCITAMMFPSVSLNQAAFAPPSFTIPLASCPGIP